MKFRTLITACSFSSLLVVAALQCGIGDIARDNKNDPKSSGGGSGGTSTATALSIEVPIEMADSGLRGNGATQNFLSTLTALDTAEYDGTRAYYFEIVAENTSGASHTVELRDSANNASASISVPTGATISRYRTAMAIFASSSVYTVYFSTAAPSTVRVYAARMIVQQTNATKARVYIPLLSGTQGANQTDGLNYVYAVTCNATGRNTALVTAWQYLSSRFPNLAASNPFTLDVVMAVSGGATIQHYLEDTANTQVAASVLSTNSATTNRYSVTLPAATFTSGTTYRIGHNCTAGAGQTSNIFHAGLWVRLSNLTYAETYYRVLDSTTAATGLVETRRVLIDTSKFSNPLVYFEITGNGASNNVDLKDNGAFDSGTGGTTSVAGSTVNTGTTFANVRSSAITLISGQRYIGSTVQNASGQFIVMVARTP